MLSGRWTPDDSAQAIIMRQSVDNLTEDLAQAGNRKGSSTAFFTWLEYEQFGVAYFQNEREPAI